MGKGQEGENIDGLNAYFLSPEATSYLLPATSPITMYNLPNMADEKDGKGGGTVNPQDGRNYDLSNIKEVDLTPAELSAVIAFQAEMQKKQEAKVAFEEAMAGWIQTMGDAWRSKKFREDMEAQRKEIEKFKWIESEKAGKDIGASQAAQEWIRLYAQNWRMERESLEENGWDSVHVIVGLPQGLHMRPSSTLANIASGFPCAVYVHRDGMEVYNFMLQGMEFINVKSLMGLLTLGAGKGVMLIFIASGQDARRALSAIAEFVSGTKSELVIMKSWEKLEDKPGGK